MSLIRLPRILHHDFCKAGTIFFKTPKFIKVQSASMTSKENRDPNVVKPAPWPYKTKKFRFWRSYFESTLKRFDENTKMVVVDGIIGSGKSAFAKQLADAFDFVYFPEPTLDTLLISPYGYDLRKIDPLLPPSFKICDISTFYKNPDHPNVPKFQFKMFMLRIEQYLNSLAHILNTGQGVVLERCIYGDFVFLETMHKFGWISGPALELYYDCRKNVLEELMRPHLVVYLDISPEVALERIKKRNIPYEVNSKVLNKEYLSTLEHFYKQRYLKEIGKHAELLIYDWNNYGDMEVVVEDIERINFDKYTKYDRKMEDWRKEDDWEWNYWRRYYTNEKEKIMDYGVIFRPQVEELTHPGDECREYKKILQKIPGETFQTGFNADAGDNVWFNTNPRSYFETRWTRNIP